MPGKRAFEEQIAALEALRHAKQKTKDPAAFSTWLNEEPAFAKLREDPQFRVLLATPDASP